MLLRLQKYDYNIIYKPGKEMILADRLSRLPSRSENLPIELHHNIQHVTFTHDKVDIIRDTTERDPILYAVYHITLNGWPNRFHKVLCIACQFLGARDELTIDNRLLLEETKYVDLLNCTKECLVNCMKVSKALKRCNTSPERRYVGKAWMWTSQSM